jgi:hypothetical protein
MRPLAWAPEETGQQERREVVDREGALQAVGGEVPVGPEPADVVDQHIQPRVGAGHLRGQTAHPGLGGHVSGKGVHHWAARCGADAGRGRLGAGLITAGDADPGAQRGEPDGDGPADATGAPGDQNGLPGHEGGVSHGSFLPRDLPKAVAHPPGQQLVTGQARIVGPPPCLPDPRRR